jgi:hypothetical protein
VTCAGHSPGAAAAALATNAGLNLSGELLFAWSPDPTESDRGSRLVLWRIVLTRTRIRFA